MNTLITNKYINAIARLDKKNVDEIFKDLEALNTAYNTNEKFNINTSVEYQLNNNGNVNLAFTRKTLNGFTNYIYNNNRN